MSFWDTFRGSACEVELFDYHRNVAWARLRRAKDALDTAHSDSASADAHLELIDAIAVAEEWGLIGSRA